MERQLAAGAAMSRNHRLALVVMDDRDNLGDESGVPDALTEKLLLSVLDAMSQRMSRMEKKLDQLAHNPKVTG